MRLASAARRVSWKASAVAAVLGATSLAGVLVGGGTATGEVDPLHVVRYHGLQLRVPASWPVVDLARRPGVCARVDRHAVYLGAPRERASCPPRITGRTETITVRPLGTRVVPDTTILPTGLPESLPDNADHSARWAVQDAGVLVTATYGRRPDLIGEILAGSSVTESARRQTTRTAPLSVPVAAPTVVPGTYRGLGFDACQTPSARTMDTWLANSRHRAIGVYIGGGDLGCPDQPNLSPRWVRRQTNRGWHIFPLYVGRQAPCTTEPYRIDPADAAHQGRLDARNAATRAKYYGMARTSIIVNDMEYYRRGGTCSSAVLTYLSAWTRELHVLHYRSGIYSSRSAAIDDLIRVRSSHRYTMPGTIDFAQWDGQARVLDAHIPAIYWFQHHRIKQFTGGHNETHGGVTINIDSDWLDIT
ncbi:MAG: DUF1906 domain-containing protein [Actinocatenispora sp.]